MKPLRMTAAMFTAMGISLFGSSLPPVQAAASFQQVTNFTIFYGEPSEQDLDRLKKKDLVIIEPQLYSKEQIAAIRSTGTTVIGYISVMESPTWNSLRMDKLEPDDYLLLQGKRVHFQQWDSYLMDLRQVHYRELLVEEIGSSITEKGLNGVFLDTIGDMDDHIKDTTVQTENREAYLEFLQKVTKQYPELLLIQNRGFDCLDYASPYIHGLLWEDWRGSWQQNPWIQTRVERLRQEQKKGLKIFSVSAGKELSHGQEARKLEFIHTDSPHGYNTMKE
jgi:hypothetical protein